jgi:hypothetical protein
MKGIKWSPNSLASFLTGNRRLNFEREMMIEMREQLRRELEQDLRMERDEKNKLNK